MPRKSIKDNHTNLNRGQRRGNTALAPLHFRCKKTSFSIGTRQRQLISLVLQGTGLRIAEVLRIENAHCLGHDQVLVLPLKRSKERVITLDPYLYKLLTEYNCRSGKIFNETYSRVYKYIKSGKTGMTLIKNDKNFSVCHSARKHWIRHQIYNLKRTVASVVKELGWQSKTSILYYLK